MTPWRASPRSLSLRQGAGLVVAVALLLALCACVPTRPNVLPFQLSGVRNELVTISV